MMGLDKISFEVAYSHLKGKEFFTDLDSDYFNREDLQYIAQFVAKKLLEPEIDKEIEAIAAVRKIGQDYVEGEVLVIPKKIDLPKNVYKIPKRFLYMNFQIQAKFKMEGDFSGDTIKPETFDMYVFDVTPL